MDSSQSANTPQREKILWAVFLLILSIWACFSYTNWISDSEFWPVTLSGHWADWKTHPSLVYKALFHGTLSWIYAFDLDSVGHLKVAKAFYSLLGVISFLLFYKILRSRLDKTKSIIVTLIFMFSHLGFSQIGLIRSDFLSFLVFEVALLSLLAVSNLEWKKMGLLNLLFAVLIFLTTPKGAYFVFILAVFSLLRVDKQYRLRLLNLFLFFVSLGMLLLYGISKFTDAFLSALRWNLDFRKGTDYNFWYTPSPLFLKNDLFLIVLISVGWITQLVQLSRKQRFTNDLAWMIIYLCGIIVLVLHKPLLPFFLGSVWGLFFFSIIPILSSIRTRYLLFVLIIGIGIFMARFSEYHHYSNRPQYQAIEEIENLVNSIPNGKVFDGLGVAPRAPHIVSYIGPEDQEANISAFVQMITEKPAVVIATHRMALINADVTSFLLNNYKQIGLGYWIRKDIEIPADFSQLSSGMHVFGFFPIPSMLKN